MSRTVLMRDATCFPNPGRATKYHFESAEGNGLPACAGRGLLCHETRIPADDVSESQRCQSPGCRKLWADEARRRAGTKEEE